MFGSKLDSFALHSYLMGAALSLPLHPLLLCCNTQEGGDQDTNGAREMLESSSHTFMRIVLTGGFRIRTLSASLGTSS